MVPGRAVSEPSPEVTPSSLGSGRQACVPGEAGVGVAGRRINASVVEAGRTFLVALPLQGAEVQTLLGV